MVIRHQADVDVPPINIGESLGKSISRRVYINKSMSAECGYLVNRPGCRAAEAHPSKKSHRRVSHQGSSEDLENLGKDEMHCRGLG